MPPRAYIIRTDGACRGNPGPASIGVALYDASLPGSDDPDATPIASISAAIGTTTNNVAEWRAVVAAIDFAAELGAREIDLLLDSKLVVEQLQGRWRVRDAKLAPLCDEALKGLTRFAHWSARHVPRALNGRADALANEALDRALRGGPAWVARRPQDAVSATATATSSSDSSATTVTRITVLGSGASRGVPRVGCRCGVCLSRDQRNRRLRSSVLVEWLDGVTERGVIIDPGMDLRQQALRHGVTRLDGALVTHIHVDHTGGIDELRAYTDAQDVVLPIGAGEATADELRKRWDYAVNGRTPPGAGIPALQLVASDSEVTIAGRSFQAIPIVHGKRPAHGWRSGGFAYLTDVSSVPAASRDLLGDLDLLIVSALRDLPHPTHQTVDEALELIRAVAPRRALLTHLDHDLDFEDLAARLPAGIAPAFDGLVVEVPAR